MMFAVIMLVNLLVAMFATTYSECTEQAELIWKFKRYFSQLIVSHYKSWLLGTSWSWISTIIPQSRARPH